MLRIPFESFKFAYEWLESLSNGSNLYSITSNLVRKGLNLDLNGLNRVLNGSNLVRIPFEQFELAFKQLNFFGMVQICILNG